jgi:RNA polymerase sigma factor (sigma-70 family)
VAENGDRLRLGLEGQFVGTIDSNDLEALLQAAMEQSYGRASAYARNAGCSAEDILHDAYEVALIKRAEIPKGYEIAWFKRVVEFKGKQALDRRRRRERFEVSEENCDLLAPRSVDAESVVSSVTQSELRQALDTELAQLSPRTAEILRQRGEERSATEIAKALGVGRGTVCKEAARGERKLSESGRLRRLTRDFLSWPPLALPARWLRKSNSAVRRLAATVGVGALIAIFVAVAIGLLAIMLVWYLGRADQVAATPTPSVDSASPSSDAATAPPEIAATADRVLPEPSGVIGGGAPDTTPPALPTEAPSAVDGAGTHSSQQPKTEPTPPTPSPPERMSVDWPGGGIRQEWFERDGKREGPTRTYRRDGTLSEVSESRAGVPHGWQYNYAADGRTVTFKCLYENGKIIYKEGKQ